MTGVQMSAMVSNECEMKVHCPSGVGTRVYNKSGLTLADANSSPHLPVWDRHGKDETYKDQ